MFKLTFPRLLQQQQLNSSKLWIHFIRHCLPFATIVVVLLWLLLWMACCSRWKITFLLNWISRKRFDLLKTMSLNTLQSTTSVWRRQSGNRASSERKVLPPVCLAKRYARMAAPRWCTRYYLHDTLLHCAMCSWWRRWDATCKQGFSENFVKTFSDFPNYLFVILFFCSMVRHVCRLLRWRNRSKSHWHNFRGVFVGTK